MAAMGAGRKEGRWKGEVWELSSTFWCNKSAKVNWKRRKR
jgi:hypothetical protein